MRRQSLPILIVLTLATGGAAAALAFAFQWLPTSASKEADRLFFSIWFATIISIVIFAIVSALLIYAVFAFRVKPGDLSDGPPTHGHTKLEIVWTVIPTIIVVAITVVSAIVLAQNTHAGKNPLPIKVYAQQFAWEFEYPNGYKSPILRLPVDRGIKLNITAKDVIHSFWVPEFGQKQDAVPGQWNEIVITPTRTGTFDVICTELCGLGHALMRSQARVDTQADFNSWYASTGTEESAADPVKAFMAAGCGGCHALKSIPSATGTVGPSLDSLSADAAKAGEPLADFIAESITDPAAFTPEDYQPGTMPPMGTAMTKAQLDALVAYLADNTN